MGLMHRQALPLPASLADGDSDASWLPPLGLKSTGSPPRSNLPHCNLPSSLKSPKAKHTRRPCLRLSKAPKPPSFAALPCLALPFHLLLEMPVSKLPAARDFLELVYRPRVLELFDSRVSIRRLWFPPFLT